VFVSPLTTLVVEWAGAQGRTAAQAGADIQAQLGLAHSPLDDFVAGADSQAATLAATVSKVAVEVAKLTVAAGVPADQAKALVNSVLLGDLGGLAERAARSSGASPSAIAAEVAAAVLQDHNLDASTVAAQAKAAQELAAPASTSDAAGDFISVRRFSYTDANNYSYTLFTGNSATLDADSRFSANEVRKTLSGGVDVPFNRNQVYWTGTEWKNCERGFRMVSTKPQTAATPQDSMYCGASRTLSRIAWSDIAGRKMAEVIAEMRAYPLADTDGLPANWGPPPSLLGDATFPSGAKLQRREAQHDIGGTERYSLTDKRRVVPASGSYRHAATFDDLKRMSGDLVNTGATVSNLNAVFLDELPAAAPGAGLKPLKRYRLAFTPGADAVRYYRCNVRVSDDGSQDCEAVGNGQGVITTQGDARVLHLSGGYPLELLTQLKRQRLFVERDGAVFGGFRDLQRTAYDQRLNKAAWDALREALGIPAHQEPQPVERLDSTGGAEVQLRRFTFADANNWSARLFRTDGVLDASGNKTIDDLRLEVAGGVAVPFHFNSLFWTGTEWYACPDDGIGVLKANDAAGTDTYCSAFLDGSRHRTTVTLDGRNMADVLRDIRWYDSKDGLFSFANWGANPDTTPALATASFPAGAQMYYSRFTRQSTPYQLFNRVTDQVRVAPGPLSGDPFDTWPFATGLDDMIAHYPGALLGGPLNGNTALWVWGWDLAAPPSATYTTRVEVRVSFDPSGQKARFTMNNRRADNGRTDNYVTLLDTTYSVATAGDAKVLRFAAMPAELNGQLFGERLYIERGGLVFYGFKDRIPEGPMYSIRMNEIAARALAATLGITLP
jgi:hypothetical protein